MAAIFARVAGNSRRRRLNFVAVSFSTALVHGAPLRRCPRAERARVPWREAALLAIVLLLGYFPTAPVVDFPTNVLPQHYTRTCIDNMYILIREHPLFHTIIKANFTLNQPSMIQKNCN